MTKYALSILTPDMASFLQKNIENDFRVVIGDAEYIEVASTSYSQPMKIFRNFSPTTITFIDSDEALLFKLRFFNEIMEETWTNEF